MIVPITAASAPPEWIVIELQGDLEATNPTGTIAGQRLGSFTILPATDRKEIPATLEIGSQLLDAKMTVLRQPIMITEKVSNEQGAVEYKVIGVVRRKFVFKNRPKPLALHKGRSMRIRTPLRQGSWYFRLPHCSESFISLLQGQYGNVDQRYIAHLKPQSPALVCDDRQQASKHDSILPLKSPRLYYSKHHIFMRREARSLL